MDESKMEQSTMEQIMELRKAKLKAHHKEMMAMMDAHYKKMRAINNTWERRGPRKNQLQRRQRPWRSPRKFPRERRVRRRSEQPRTDLGTSVVWP
jgi:hypothetical protein